MQGFKRTVERLASWHRIHSVVEVEAAATAVVEDVAAPIVVAVIAAVVVAVAANAADEVVDVEVDVAEFGAAGFVAAAIEVAAVGTGVEIVVAAFVVKLSDQTNQ